MSNGQASKEWMKNLSSWVDWKTHWKGMKTFELNREMKYWTKWKERKWMNGSGSQIEWSCFFFKLFFCQMGVTNLNQFRAHQ
jgi:peptidyl-tRNA hydrolase